MVQLLAMEPESAEPSPEGGTGEGHRGHPRPERLRGPKQVARSRMRRGWSGTSREERAETVVRERAERESVRG
jgi:hypothetical protein